MIAANAVYFASVSSLTYIHLENWDANQLFQLLSASWHPPPPEWIKVNIDASLLRSNRAGIGGVFRDHKGMFLLVFGFMGLHWDVAQVELIAILSLERLFKIGCGKLKV
ncbi:hypothetical protein IEQ34_008497 [Dendrobium chrysotoxum]|uniref:RNase H type-1 domain-containing protein n=1 Tax=Dendrobium chrysotoxum TaxID=161865 RepID=A0AAV7GZD4_DENCH|nr:hypothetical protein IEQ34_008497 [Dendrobium chrysotoxum]